MAERGLPNQDDAITLLTLTAPSCSAICLVRLQAVCKQGRTLSTAHLNSTAHLCALLFKAVKDAAAAVGVRRSKLYRLVGWLLRVARDKNMRLEDIEYDWCSIPGITTALAQPLLAAGVKITDSRILAAAQKCVPGLEKWGFAHNAVQRRPVGLTPNESRTLSEMVEGFCRGETNCTVFGALVTPSPLLLQLAVNIEDSGLAGIIFGSPVALGPPKPGSWQSFSPLPAHLISRLLRTAVLRRHTRLVRYFLQLPAVAQISTPAALRLLRAAASVKQSKKDAVAELLLERFAGPLWSVDAEAVAGLLDAAVRHNNDDLAAKICRLLPAAHRFSGDVFNALLVKTAQLKCLRTMQSMCNLRAAINVTSGTIAAAYAAVLAAMKSDETMTTTERGTAHFKQVYALSLQQIGSLASKQLPGEVQACDQAAVADLVHLPLKFADFLDRSSLHELVKAAHPNSAQVVSLLETALEQKHWELIDVLVHTTGAKQLDGELLAKACLCAVKDKNNVVKALLRLPGLQQLSTPTVAELLDAAAEHGQWFMFEALTSLPAAQQLSGEWLAGVYLRAKDGNYAAVKALARLPAWASMYKFAASHGQVAK